MLQALKEVDVAQAEFDKRNQQLQIKLTQRRLDGSGARSRTTIITRNADLATENARMMQRAYTLGEVGFQVSLLATKHALDANRQALEIRIDVFRSTLWSRRLMPIGYGSWTRTDPNLPGEVPGTTSKQRVLRGVVHEQRLGTASECGCLHKAVNFSSASKMYKPLIYSSNPEGNTSPKVVTPCSDSAKTVPPCIFAIAFTMARPRP